MRAIQVTALAADIHDVPSRLAVNELASPEPGPDDVRIAVHAAGVNFPDLLMIAGQYQFQPPLPFTPGAEFAGVVTAVGAQVTDLSVGARIVGTALVGGFAEEAVVAAADCTPLPDDIDFADAAVLPLAFGTALHALRDRGRLQAGETLLVTGATGGTGSAAVKLGRIMGARVVAAVGSPEKRDLAGSMGADVVIEYGTGERFRDVVKEATDGRGADVVFDAVGGDVFAECTRAIAWDGRLLVVGFTSGTIPQVPANLVLLKGSSVVGVFWGRWRQVDPAAAHAQIAELARLVADGRLDTGISARYPLDATGDALAAIANRTVAGKVVITPGQT